MAIDGSLQVRKPPSESVMKPDMEVLLERTRRTSSLAGTIEELSVILTYVIGSDAGP